jgi:hypothetical protein
MREPIDRAGREENSTAEPLHDPPFDVSQHQEALRSFARMGLAQASLRPALRARDLVFNRHPGCRFGIRLAVAPEAAKAEAILGGAIAFEVIHPAESALEAASVRGEVERYFLRHFPGRTLRAEEADGSVGTWVCVACYPAER